MSDIPTFPDSFKASDWYVADTSPKESARLVRKYHYSRHSNPAGIYVHGLFLRGGFSVWGCAIWLIAVKGSVDKFNPGGLSTSLVLHRLVVHPDVPTNGASFLMGRSIRAIAKEGKYDFLVTYADTWQGHTGAIYKATNWTYEGLSEPYQVWLTKKGEMTGRQGSRGTGHRALLNSDLRDAGCSFAGAFRKHIFTMRLNLKKQSQTLDLFPQVQL